MKIDKSHIELKDEIETDEELIEYYKRKFDKMAHFNPELKKFQSLLEDTLEYEISYSRITNKNGEDVTVAEFLNDLMSKVEENPEFEIDVRVCKHLVKYIDFDKTNINVSAPVNIKEEEQKFLKQMDNCTRIIKIEMMDLSWAEDIEWIRDEKNIQFAKSPKDQINITGDELINRHKIYKDYMNTKGMAFGNCEYNYFIKNSYTIYNEEDLHNFKKYENWKETAGYEKGKINLEIFVQRETTINMDELKQLLQTTGYTAIVKRPYNEKNITLEDIKIIKKLKEIGVEFNTGEDELCLTVDTIDQISEDVIEEFGIRSVLIGSNENKSEEELAIDKYYKIRNILDEVVNDIDAELSDKEKFKIIYTRLANMLTYDYEAIREEAEYAKENVKKCRNLENGVLLGKCVCAGFSEILKQTLSLVGIESHYISSKKDKEGDKHAYNVVKIDGKWYNADLTWDYEFIRNKIPPKYCLRNDKDFTNFKENSNNKELHTPDEHIEWSCDESSINLYPEFNKNAFLKKVKLFGEMAKQTGIKQIAKNIKEMIESKFIKKENLLLEANIDETNGYKPNNFKKTIQQSAPTMEEQAEFVSELLLEQEEMPNGKRRKNN